MKPIYGQSGEVVGYTGPRVIEGRYEIEVRPSASGRTEVITHRFFRPGFDQVISKSFTEDEFITVLGKSSESPEFRRRVESINLRPEIKQFEGERTYYTFGSVGLEFVFDDDCLVAAHYFGPNSESDVKPYQGLLPKGLSFSDSRDIVLQKLGEPRKVREGVDDPRPFVQAFPSLQYSLHGYSLHVEFLMDGSAIRMVTLRRATTSSS